MTSGHLEQKQHFTFSLQYLQCFCIIGWKHMQILVIEPKIFCSFWYFGPQNYAHFRDWQLYRALWDNENVCVFLAVFDICGQNICKFGHRIPNMTFCGLWVTIKFLQFLTFLTAKICKFGLLEIQAIKKSAFFGPANIHILDIWNNTICRFWHFGPPKYSKFCHWRPQMNFWSI